MGQGREIQKDLCILTELKKKKSELGGGGGWNVQNRVPEKRELYKAKPSKSFVKIP